MKRTPPDRIGPRTLRLIDGLLAIAALLGLLKPTRFSLRRARRM